MASKKTTRRALFSSVISLVLCMAMLVGTTFAWFTDEVVSGTNVITAGNLDIELEYYDGSNWKTVNGATELFTGNLWEPGHTEVVYLKLSNLGTLALKYQLGINIASETEGTNVADETFKLSDHIYMGVVEAMQPEYASREEAIAAAMSGVNGIIGSGYTKSGSMTADAADLYMAVVVYMPESVGNVANYKTGTTAPQINLGINLFATQLEAEEDSFGSDYDGTAPWAGGVDTAWYDDPDATEYVIDTAEELAGLAALVNGTQLPGVEPYAQTAAPTPVSFKGKTVKLGADVDLRNIDWTPIGTSTNRFKGTFDGQGYTVSNLYFNNSEVSYIGLFGYANDKATIKNVNVHNVNLTGYSQVGSIAGRVYTGTVSGCHVTGSVNLVAQYAYAGGIVGGDYVELADCSVIAEGTGSITVLEKTGAGGICGWHTEGNYGLKNLHVKNLKITAWSNLGGITGFVHYDNTISECSVEQVELNKTRVDGHPGIGLAAGGWSYNASHNVTIKDNTFKNITLNGTAVSISSANILYGSEYSGNTTSNVVAENNTQEGITNNLVYLNEIKTVEDLENALATGGKYVLKNNLELTGAVTAPSGVETELYMNNMTIAGTNSGTATHNDLFLVKGTLTVNGGTITQTHAADNMGWNGCTNTFDVTAGGVLNLKGVTVKNLGGTDMNFAVHMNNWGEVTLNVEDSFLEATYMPVRVFNSGPDMNNVTIKNSTLKSEKNHSFWVHNYASSDFGGKLYSGSSEAYDEARVAARLNFNIFGNGNTFITGKAAPVRYGFNSSLYFNDGGKEVVITRDGLQAALDKATNGTVITLAADITGDVTATQKPDVKVTIDGNGKTFAGVLTVDGKSGTYTTAGLTIKNVNFVAESISADACIRLGNGSNDTRYTCNVTVENCTFDVPGAVGVKSYTGGDKNLTITGCTATANAHSLVQAKGIDGILIEKCKVYSKNGMNFNNSDNVTVSGTTADVKGYAVRFGESSGGVGAAETYLIKDCTLKSANDDGDAVIILRGTADNATLTIENTTLTGNPEITNNATGATVVK